MSFFQKNISGLDRSAHSKCDAPVVKIKVVATQGAGVRKVMSTWHVMLELVVEPSLWLKFVTEVVHLANWPHKQVVVDGAGPVLDLDGRGQVLQVGRLTFRFQLRLQQLGQDVVDVVGLRRCPSSALETRRFVSVESFLQSLPLALKVLDFRFQAPIEDRVGLIFLKNGCWS